MRWQQKLTKTQLKHLKDCGITTLTAFIRCRKQQLSDMRKFDANPQNAERSAETVVGCWDCREIAKRLQVCDFAPEAK